MRYGQDDGLLTFVFAVFEGEGVAYRGRIFVELETILGETPNESVGDVSNSDLIRTLPYQSRKKYKLHAAFLDASMLYEHESTIEFEISIGNYGNKFDDLGGNANCSTTPPTNPVFDGTSYYFLPWGHTKPCVQVASEWEDLTFRLEAMNQLAKIKLFIVSHPMRNQREEQTFSFVRSFVYLVGTPCSVALGQNEQSIGENPSSTLQTVAGHDHFSSQVTVEVSQSARLTFLVCLRKPLPDPESSRHHVNELDRLRRLMREKDLAQMIHKLEQLKAHAETSQEIIDTLEDIRQHLQHLQSEVCQS